MFIIEDERHAEPQGEFATLKAAVSELERRAKLPWNEPPNVAPCTNWQNRGRTYELVEWDVAERKQIRRIGVLEITAAGVTWLMPLDTLKQS